MSSQLSYRLQSRKQRPKALRNHHRDELDTGQVKASAKVAESLFRKAVGDGLRQFSAPLRPVHGHYAGERSQVATTKTDQNVSAVRCLLVHLLMSALGAMNCRNCPPIQCELTNPIRSLRDYVRFPVGWSLLGRADIGHAARNGEK